jgi:hypothetical protein
MNVLPALKRQTRTPFSTTGFRCIAQSVRTAVSRSELGKHGSVRHAGNLQVVRHLEVESAAYAQTRSGLA